MSGSTGLATAPHLDYRMQRDGRWMNPLTLKSKPAEPIPLEQLPEFESWRDLLRAGLQSGDSIDLTPISASGQVADLEVSEPPVGERRWQIANHGRGALLLAPGAEPIWRAEPWIFGPWACYIVGLARSMWLWTWRFESRCFAPVAAIESARAIRSSKRALSRTLRPLKKVPCLA